MSRPIYDKVARDIGVSGDAKAEEIWRPAGDAYPMPPMKTFRNGEIWLKGFEAAGIRMVPAAVGMNSTEYKGRPACIYDGWCHVGCPIGALANPTGDLSRRGQQGRRRGARAGALSRAFSPTRRAPRSPASSITTRRSERQVQEASVVVLAAWAAQNPRLLLNSATDKHPKGLANANGLVGKYMMTHFSSGTSAHLRRGCREPHGHDRRASTCPTSATARPRHKGAFGSSFIVGRYGTEDQRPRRLRQCPARSVRSGAAAYMKRAARGFTRIGAFGEEHAEYREPHRARQRQG